MRPTAVEIDTQALLHNLSVAKQYAPTSRLMAMVKANAYGHGIDIVCPTLAPKIDSFGVGFVDEAIAVASLGLNKPISILEGFFSLDELHYCSEHDFQVVIHESKQLEQLLNAKLKSPVSVWLKLDSGMHRLGFDEATFHQAYDQLNAHENVKALGLLSHLACADGSKPEHTARQLERYFAETNRYANKKSLAKSAAICAHPDTHLDVIRPGIMLYGGETLVNKTAAELGLQPVMHFNASIIAIRHLAKGEHVGYGATYQVDKPMRLATLSCGYGDGYPRLNHPDAHVLIRGRACPIVGRISMELMTVDVSQVDPLSIGDKAMLWGPGLPCALVASWCNTIDYELMTRATLRVKPQVV